MNFTGQTISVRLSSNGTKALRGLVPPKGSFQTIALSADSLGAWVLLPTKARSTGSLATPAVPVILLKWEYIAAVGFDFKPEPSVAKGKVGFHS